MSGNAVVIGIDPGKGGGLAAIETMGDINVTPMFIAGKELDIPRISDWIYDRGHRTSVVIVCIEKVHAMSKPGQQKQGVVSMFTFGKNVGILYGIIGSMLIPLYEVAPQTWKKVILADTPKDKQAAIDYCMRRFPSVSLLATPRSRKPHDGMADALCIAAYALVRYKDVL